MSYQVLALDLDGTTLRDDHTLNPWVIECAAASEKISRDGGDWASSYGGQALL